MHHKLFMRSILVPTNRAAQNDPPKRVIVGSFLKGTLVRAAVANTTTILDMGGIVLCKILKVSCT